MPTFNRPLWAIGLLLQFVNGTPAQGPVSYETIREAWLARQKKCDTVRVAWTHEVTIPKGTLIDVTKMGGKAGGTVHPPRDLLTHGRTTLLMAGGKYRIEKTGETWSIERQAVEAYESDYFRSENRYVDFYKKIGIYPYGTAHLHQADRKGLELRTTAIVPITTTFRGAFGDDPFGDLLADYETTDRTAVVGGRSCVEMSHKKRTQNLTDSLWLDPTRDFLVVKRVVTNNSATMIQLDVELTPHPVIGWAPKSWKSVSFSRDRKVTEAVKCDVTVCDIGVSVRDGDFEPVFPPGTRVADHTGSKEEEYVVQGDGREGGRVASSQLPTYEQLAAASPPNRWVRPLLIGIGGLAVAAAAVWVWNRFLRRRAG